MLVFAANYTRNGAKPEKHWGVSHRYSKQKMNRFLFFLQKKQKSIHFLVSLPESNRLQNSDFAPFYVYPILNHLCNSTLKSSMIKALLF